MIIKAYVNSKILEESILDLDVFRKQSSSNEQGYYLISSKTGYYINVIEEKNEYSIEESDESDTIFIFEENNIILEKDNKKYYLNWEDNDWKILEKPIENQSVYSEDSSYLDSCIVTASGSQGAVYMNPRLRSEGESEDNYEEVSKIFFGDNKDPQYLNPKFDFLRENKESNEYVFTLKRVEKVKGEEIMHFIYEMGIRHREYVKIMKTIVKMKKYYQFYSSFKNILKSILFLFSNNIVHRDIRYTNYAVDRKTFKLKLIDLSDSCLDECNELIVLCNPFLSKMIKFNTGIKQINCNRENFPYYEDFMKNSIDREVFKVKSLTNLHKRYNLYSFFYSIIEISKMVGISKKIYSTFLPLYNICDNYEKEDITEDFCNLFEEIVEAFLISQKI